MVSEALRCSSPSTRAPQRLALTRGLISTVLGRYVADCANCEAHKMEEWIEKMRESIATVKNACRAVGGPHPAHGSERSRSSAAS